MKTFLTIILSLFFSGFLFSADKYALIIAVGDYQPETNWSKISSANDVPLIQSALEGQGFSAKNIRLLQDAKATKQGILNALDQLLADVKKGDIVVIHYSGHGQQIEDDNGDEADGLDEALVPYDAMAFYKKDVYWGQNHIRDDELEVIIANFRAKLGKDGQLLMILDSCHSGSATRGGKARGGAGPLVSENWNENNYAQSRGNTTSQSGLFNEKAGVAGMSPFVMLSGASANQLNYEYQGKGSLSYAFSKAMTGLGESTTYRRMFATIVSEMQLIAPRQNPVIEGDVDYLLFSGKYVAQQSYFEVKRIDDAHTVILGAGKLNGLFEGATVLLMPSGSSQKEASKAIARGEIQSSTYNEAVLVLEKPLSDFKTKSLWAFVDKPSFNDINVSVYFDPKAGDKQLKNEVEKFLAENNIGKVVNRQFDSDLSIIADGDKYDIAVTNDLGTVELVEKSRGPSIAADLNQKIFKFAQGQYLKGLSLKNPEYEFSFRLVPSDVTDPKTYKNESADGILKVVPQKDEYYLEITNHSNSSIYVSIVEINSKGEIASFFPISGTSCDLNDQERQIPPRSTIPFKRCTYTFAPPYETLMLKGFATKDPLNLKTTAESEGQSTRGMNSNPLEKFLNESYKTRGREMPQQSDGVDGYSNEFVYEIVKQK